MGEKVHGGGKYAIKIFLELMKSEKPGIRIFALFDSKMPVDANLTKLLEERGGVLVDIRKQTIKEVIVNNQINRCYFALTHNIGFNFLELLDIDCETVTTIHGLRDLELIPGVDSLKYINGLQGKLKALAKIVLRKRLYNKKYSYYSKLLEKAKIITVSNHSKFAIKAYYPEYKQDINVFYSPDVTDIDNNDEPEETLNERGYYLLLNGNRWIKNNLRSAIALDQLFTENKELTRKVIITGVANKNFYLKHLKNPERFIFYDFVSEGFLKLLFKNAFSLIYMSLNEGFGYPPIEAMKYGTPVIASPFTSIYEICGIAASYSNPYAVQEIKNRILQLEDPAIYNSLKENGLNRFDVINSIQKSHLESMVEYLCA
ncbi:MAG: glycosyltransferase [Mucilaginibacter sp.]